MIGTTVVAISPSAGSMIIFNWFGVTKLDFVGALYYTIDDLTFNENTNVPEPGLVALDTRGAVGVMRDHMSRA